MTRIFFLVVLTIIPAFALLVLDHHRDHRQREREAEMQALRSARLVGGELEQILASVESLLSAAAQAPIVQSLQEPGCSEYLARLSRINPSAGIIAVTGADGRTRCGGSPGADLSDRTYFQEALGSQDLVVGEYALGRASGIPILPLALRIETEAGSGVIATGLKLDWLRQHFIDRHHELPPQSALTITDRQGMILVRLPDFDQEGTLLSRFPEITTSEGGGVLRSTTENSSDGVARFIGFTSPSEAPALGLSVAIGLPQEAVLAEIRRSAFQNYLLLALIALMTFFLAALGGRQFVHRPVCELLSTIESWRKGNLAARTTPRTLPPEFAQIGFAFNAMADDLEAAMHHKDILFRELNHRVMNSLSTISALLRGQARKLSDKAAKEQFDNAIKRIDAMALAYRRMHSHSGTEALDFAKFLHELCHDLQASMMEDITPCIVEADPLELSLDQAMPLILIVNELLTNALKHGAGEAAPVRVTLTVLDGECRVAVRNAGALPVGYDPGNTEGFGMRMIAGMVQQLQGKLEATTTDGETEFAVTFPPAVPESVLSEGSFASL